MMMRFHLCLLTVALALASGVGGSSSAFAFQPNLAVRKKLSSPVVSPKHQQPFLSSQKNTVLVKDECNSDYSSTTKTTAMWSTPPSSSNGDGNDDNGDDQNKSTPTKKSGGGGALFDEGLRSKLVSESIAPWRTVRLFFYGSLGTGALIGGLVTLSGTAAALSGARPDLDLNEQYLNLAVDFGALAAFGFLAKYDLDKQKLLSERVDGRIEQKREQKVLVKGMQKREQKLGTLKLAIQTGPDGSTREVVVREVQAGASQHMIVVAGPRKACKDALVGANLMKMDLDFAMKNVLVVPYETGVDETELNSRPSGGFADRPMYETQPYVAQPVGEGWDEYIQAEMSDAVKQNGDKAKKEGIAIVVLNNGKVLRRGVGTVPWRQMVEQLGEEAKAVAKEGQFFS